MNATAPLVLTETEVQTLEIWARMAASPRLALRARIVLAAASGSRNREIADQLCVSPKTVALWRRRFLNARLSGIEKKLRAADAWRAFPNTSSATSSTQLMGDRLTGDSGRPAR